MSCKKENPFAVKSGKIFLSDQNQNSFLKTIVFTRATYPFFNIIFNDTCKSVKIHNIYNT